MLFQVPSFLLFFVVFSFFLIILPGKWTKVYVVLASILFYSFWYYPYTLLLLFFIGFSWGACNAIYKRPELLPVCVVLALMPLLFFKYTHFILQSFGVESDPANYMLPLGISFVTFTIISMIIDLKNSHEAPESLLNISLYITFFPHLLAGPILRSRQLIPQLEDIKLTVQNVSINLPLFAVGIIKKTLIADPIGQFINPVYTQPTLFSGPEILLACIAFSVQIYCDFSAYTDMAIALAGMLNVQFPQNFRSPFLSHSISEIWKRWHMTLSFWLRDYLYFPLREKIAQYSAIIITMVISGFWHGAGWTFAIWGGIQGVVMVIEKQLHLEEKIQRFPMLKYCMIPFVFMLWSLINIFFRAHSVTIASDMFHTLIQFNVKNSISFHTQVIILVGIVLALHPFDQVDTIRSVSNKLPTMLKIPLAMGIIISCAVLAWSHPQEFYYFDF
jgi:alginate O-acetyltransferase complex protein AlgI